MLSATIFCTECKEEKIMMYASGEVEPSVCHDCTFKESEKKKQKSLLELKCLSVEERLVRIETWIYDHSQVPHGYQNPPLY